MSNATLPSGSWNLTNKHSKLSISDFQICSKIVLLSKHSHHPPATAGLFLQIQLAVISHLSQTRIKVPAGLSVGILVFSLSFNLSSQISFRCFVTQSGLHR